MQSANKLKIAKITNLPYALLTFLYLFTSHGYNNQQEKGDNLQCNAQERKIIKIVSIGI